MLYFCICVVRTLLFVPSCSFCGGCYFFSRLSPSLAHSSPFFISFTFPALRLFLSLDSFFRYPLFSLSPLLVPFLSSFPFHNSLYFLPNFVLIYPFWGGVLPFCLSSSSSPFFLPFFHLPRALTCTGHNKAAHIFWSTQPHTLIKNKKFRFPLRQSCPN